MTTMIARRKQDNVAMAQQPQPQPLSPNGFLRIHKRTPSDLSSQENGERLSCYITSPSSCYNDSGSKPFVMHLTNKLRANLRQVTGCWRNVDISSLACESSAGLRKGYGGGKGKSFGRGGRSRSSGTSQVIMLLMCGAVLLCVGMWVGAQLYNTFSLHQSLPFVSPDMVNSRRLVEHTSNVRGHHHTVTEQDSTPPEEDDAVGPRLAYGIMVYQRQDYEVEKTMGQFKRMFDAMYDEHNTYVIHTDVKSDEEIRQQVSDHIRPFSNAHEIPSVSVSWAGITVVERTLALMDKALEVDDKWKYFVNIGHEDYPSASQSEMRQWLKKREDGTNFIYCWPIDGHNFFGQWEGHGNRVKDVHVDDYAGTVINYVTQDGIQGSDARSLAKDGYHFYKSLQQTMLSRELSTYATRSSESRRLLTYMSTSEAPDELFFPTLTQLDERYASRATCDDSRHFSFWVRPGGSWHPEYLTLDHLPMIMKATQFYIRKVEEDQGSKPLLGVLDSLRNGNPIDDSLPVLKEWLNRKDVGKGGGRPNVTGGPIIEFTDGTAADALMELSRRVEEDAETRRCLHVQGETSHRQHKERDVPEPVPVKGPLTEEQAAAEEAEEALRMNKFKKRSTRAMREEQQLQAALEHAELDPEPRTRTLDKGDIEGPDPNGAHLEKSS